MVGLVPAPFVRDLCRYRATNGKPNTSDASHKLSVEIGEALFSVLGISNKAASDKDEPTGSVFATAVAVDLAEHVAAAGMPVDVIPEQPLNEFEQYRHVGRLGQIKPGRSKEFDRAWKKLTAHLRRDAADSNVDRIESLISDVESILDMESQQLQSAIDEFGTESLLGLDVTVSRPAPTVSALPHLETGLSLKWSLRTDRAQDCRSQGAKMSALRRGQMPHFAAVTMEPRPYMLNLLGGGSGDIDCVYHLDLQSLTTAVNAVYTGNKQRVKGRDLFHRLVDKRRIRDYDELVDSILAR